MADAELKLAQTFGEIARTLMAESGSDATLYKIVSVALELIDTCEHAGIDIVHRRTISPVAPSSEVAERIDAIQTEVGEGPCFSAIRQHLVFSTGDLEHEDRWPKFAARAFAETGVRSIMGFRLYANEDTIGALDLYSTQAHAFDDHTAALGSILAAHAAVALFAALQEEQLTEALETRGLIGQAMGILMSRSNITEDAALQMLRSASSRMNTKLRDVADQIVHPRQPEQDDHA